MNILVTSPWDPLACTGRAGIAGWLEPCIWQVFRVSSIPNGQNMVYVTLCGMFIRPRFGIQAWWVYWPRTSEENVDHILTVAQCDTGNKPWFPRAASRGTPKLDKSTQYWFFSVLLKRLFNHQCEVTEPLLKAHWITSKQSRSQNLEPWHGTVARTGGPVAGRSQNPRRAQMGHTGPLAHWRGSQGA